MNKHEDFLEFNGKTILFTNVNGETFVAVKPICEALEIDYEAQRKAINRSKLLSQLPSKQTVVAKDNRLRKMLCFNEKYVYGWLFSINSESEELIEYQKTCCDLLYNHFHGTITRRSQILKEHLTEERERIELVEKLRESEDYLRLKEIDNNKKYRNKSLKNLDIELLEHQVKLTL